MEMLAKMEEGRVVTLAEYEARIHLYKEQIGTGYIGIGRTLNEAKEAKVVPHGQWEEWVTKTTGLTPRQAQRCMQAATEIRDGSAMARLEMSKALLLLGSGLDEEAREEIAAKAADDGATVKALREEILQVKAERQQVEDQLRAREEAHREQLETVRDEAYRRGEGAGKLEAAEHYREEIRQKEETIRDHAIVFESNERANRENLEKIFSLQDDLERERERVTELRKQLDEQQTAAPDADREILLQAAAEAEQRAADAEAELEALKAGGAGQPEPVWKVLKVAMTRFMTDCEMMPLDPAAMAADKVRIEANLTRLEKWADMMRIALAGVVPGEGAVQ